MDRTHPRLVSFIITDGKQLKSSLFFKVFLIQLSQLRLNPPRLGLKCGKRVERFSDFGKYKGNFRNHTTSLQTYRTLSKWGKWVDRLSDFGKYKGYIRNHPTSLPAYRTLSQVRGGSTSADLAVYAM